MTACDDPYMGEESIRRPPAPKKARITSAQASRATGSSPTLKVIQLPSPTSGKGSPLDGIGFVSGAACWAAAIAGRTSAAVPAAAAPASSARRLKGGTRFISAYPSILDN